MIQVPNDDNPQQEDLVPVPRAAVPAAVHVEPIRSAYVANVLGNVAASSESEVFQCHRLSLGSQIQRVSTVPGDTSQEILVGSLQQSTAVPASSSQRPILAQSLPQRIVLNSGHVSDVFVRLSPSTGTSPQFMVLEPSGTGFLPAGDVTKVHSYSLASAAGGGVQKVVLSATPSHHKTILTTGCSGNPPPRMALKRARPEAASAPGCISEINSHVCFVNKLLSGLVAAEAKVAASIQSSPKQKRIKIEKVTVNKDAVGKRKKVVDYFNKKIQLLQYKYYNQLAEYFFLKNGGNIMDHVVWKKKFPSELLEFLRANKFDACDDVKCISDCLIKWFSGVSNPGFQNEPVPSPKSSLSPSSRVLTPSSKSAEHTVSPSKANRSSMSPHKLMNSISSVYDSQIGSQEEIVERAKQEAYVMQRVSDLRREGLWSLKRLPKVAETPRIKAHWDYLLEEMVWLATDFAQERKWKKAAAKKCARMITKYFQEKEIKAEKAEKEEQMRLKKIASTMAREIKQFWNNIEKLVEYRQQTWLEEKRKKVLDTHLNFIVDQTEKYSSWLTQGLNRSVNDSPESSRPSSPCPNSASSKANSSDFEVDGSSESDDEATIKEAEECVNAEEQNEEIKLLQQESEMSLEDVLETLPAEMLNERALFSPRSSANEIEAEDDEDFEVSEEEDDDEQTLLEQEGVEGDVDHQKEIKELEADNELSLDELKKKYAAGDYQEDSRGSSSSEEEESEPSKKESSPSKDISDIAATAESFQPKGNTLSTTQVVTKVPFLLKHTLREYQHIGLDWLNAMYEKKLNGILADEMGLGKTIQTISLLAHLACEKGVWGPHLIVVPTSVMLNWEMELKKWCPAFKILTYYGTPKERKLKRVGWTKPNAFHVCITSYKLVVQDHQSFRRKKWKYLILDEAQHIKNFKSQRWQMLLNFQSTHRLLLTGTPLQNNLMELWSLMHFLMPNVFSSHKEFKEWFVNPVTGMIEGSHDYNESLIKRLHKVLRPFLLRRLKSEVEKQLPQKYEHVIVCRLSKRQRYLYDDFMSQTKTKETLATGNFMSVINILMQLRKVCNHPNMFEERPTISPFLMEGITLEVPSLVFNALKRDCRKQISFYFLNLLLADLEIILTAYAAHRVKKFQTPPKMIIEIDSWPEPPPPCPSVKMRVNFCNSQPTPDKSKPTVTAVRPNSSANRVATSSPGQRLMVIPGQPRNVNPVSAIHQSLGEPQYTLQLLQPGSNVASPGLTLQLHPSGSNRVQCIQSIVGGIGRMVQTSSGVQWVITPSPVSEPVNDMQQVVLGSNIATAKVMPQVHKSGQTASPSVLSSFSRPQVSNGTSVSGSSNLTVHNKPIGRVAPLNVHPPTTSSASMPHLQNHVQVSKSPVVHSLFKPAVKSEPDGQSSLFHLDSVTRRKEQSRKEHLQSLAYVNSRRCTACPLYGGDLVDTISLLSCSQESVHPFRNKWGGFLNTSNPVFSGADPCLHLHTTRVLTKLVKTASQRLLGLEDLIKRFVFVVPAVTSTAIQLHVSHPHPSEVNSERLNTELLEKLINPVFSFLHPLVSNMKTQFPELRLIEYDCGKLQTLSHLLRNLKDNHHRVLIFTQMTRMLDILEQFLNYHGHTYLRLDGNTKVEQRQALMERFNADPRIFCFILSTRSGGIGVNLTGADTVIFYDSDWNPTMDAQAQDRCHRIGQTRDVHIYRLISKKTVEENILKKANQKRLLGDLAIEGGNFNTAFFKKNAIQELFGIDDIKEESTKIEKPQKEAAENFSQTQFEQALGMAEEETDLLAAKTAHAEADAELAEFDESIPLDNDSRENEEKSPAEEELEKLMDQLTPVEKYAVQFLESLQEPLSLEQLKLAEEEIEAQKKDWELGHLKALKEEEERRLGLADEDSLLFCSRESANQDFFSEKDQEEMPIWAPPTPPTSDNDIYFDPALSFWYEPSVMHELCLPPVFIKKEPKRQPIVSASLCARKQKSRKDDMLNIPRSLFDRPSQAILKMRREAKLQKVKGLMIKPISPFSGLKQPTAAIAKPAPDLYQDKPEWLVHEDFAILQVIQDYQSIPLSLTILMPGHIPNWDLCSDAVNSVSRIHRSSRMCRSRYENVIMPREEGKIFYDKKPKKTKGIYKTKNNRPMKTSHLLQQDNNGSFMALCSARHKMMLDISQKHRAGERVSSLQPSKSSKMVTVLAENSINFDEPLSPMQIAANRAQRIAREKQKPVVAQAIQTTSQAVVQLPESQRPVQQVAAATGIVPHQAQAVIASLAQAQQLQLGKSSHPPGVATPVSMAKPLTSSIMVNTATITKALGQASVGAQRSPVTPTTMTVQEMVAAASSQVRTLTTAVSGASTAPAVVSVSGLTTVQLASTQRITQGAAVSTVASVNPPRQLSQIQAIRQSALLRQREQNLTKQQFKRQPITPQPAAAAKVATTSMLATASQQRQVTMKQSRPLTDAEMSQLVKRQQQKQVQLTTAQILAQAQLQQVQPQQVSITGSTATLVKTVSAPTSVTIPVSAVTMGGVNINVSLPQAKTGAIQSKGATTITNQQLRQFQLQQQLLNQARKGKVPSNLTQLAKVSKQGSSPIPTPVNAVQIVQHSPSSQQVKGLSTAMTVQQIQQAMKAIPQNLPVVVTATPSTGVKAQTTTLPSTTLTTSGVLKGTPAVVVGQQQILQPSSAAQHAVTLAVRATTSQATPGQVQIQVQPSAHSSLAQARIQQLSQSPSTINITPVQASSILTTPPSAAIVQQMPADSTGSSIQSSTHMVVHSVAITNPSPAAALSASPQTTSVQAVIQAARQQQQKASPYTMRLRNPPK